eukprot:jgi/Botrbrau1/21229/Bobra.39_2s0028.1
MPTARSSRAPSLSSWRCRALTGTLTECAPRVQVNDEKGDSLAYPKVITALPFTDKGNTYFFEDDYQAGCDGPYVDTGGAPDVVYYLAPRETGYVTISLCPGQNNPDAFDTKLYVMEDLLDPSSPVAVAQCNDDHCSYQSQITMRMEAGRAYAVVVDGFGQHFGPYQISITSTKVGPPLRP